MIYMSKYKVVSYIRLSRDESYSYSDSIDNQIKLTDFYCEENNLEAIDKYIDNDRKRFNQYCYRKRFI